MALCSTPLGRFEPGPMVPMTRFFFYFVVLWPIILGRSSVGKAVRGGSTRKTSEFRGTWRAHVQTRTRWTSTCNIIAAYSSFSKISTIQYHFAGPASPHADSSQVSVTFEITDPVVDGPHLLFISSSCVASWSPLVRIESGSWRNGGNFFFDFWS
jgi:hypothetical protein